MGGGGVEVMINVGFRAECLASISLESCPQPDLRTVGAGGAEVKGKAGAIIENTAHQWFRTYATVSSIDMPLPFSHKPSKTSCSKPA